MAIVDSMIVHVDVIADGHYRSAFVLNSCNWLQTTASHFLTVGTPLLWSVTSAVSGAVDIFAWSALGPTFLATLIRHVRL